MTTSELLVYDDPAQALAVANDPAGFVVEACERAKSWLAYALDHHATIQEIVNTKSYAEVLAVASREKQLGRDAELAASEIVRRAERAIGKTIREAQERGEIARASKEVGRVRHPDAISKLPTAAEAAGLHNGERADIYAMTDGVTDAEFELALDAGKAEGNLSRANVVRKVKNDEARGKTKRPDVLRKTRRIDSNRVIGQIVLNANPGAKDFLELIDYSALDRDQLQGWVNSLAASIRSLQTIKTALAKELTRD